MRPDTPGRNALIGWTIFVVMCGIAAIFLIVAHASAHDAGHPELNEWFNRLQSGKGLCCTNNDGTVLDDPDWETKNGKYRVRIDGQWVEVPDDAVITEPNRAGRTMVWPLRGYLGISVRCFMPGSMT